MLKIEQQYSSIIFNNSSVAIAWKAKGANDCRFSLVTCVVQNFNSTPMLKSLT